MNIIKKNDKPIKDILNIFIKKNKDIQRGLAVLDIDRVFREKMGPTVSKYTKEIFFRETTLYIHVTSAPLKSELQFSKDSLMKLMNESIGEELVQQIRFI